MPNYTTYLNLEKPLQSEQYDVDVFNSNCDKIDNFASSITIPLATTQSAGIVKPDGSTITITQDGTISGTNPLPSQAGNSGKFLTTNGTSPSWDTLPAADKDLSNLTSIGETHFLNKSQISNCILETPSVNVSVSNSTVTITSGSVLVFPYGTVDLSSQYSAGDTFGTDMEVVDTSWDSTNNRFFIIAKTTADKTNTYTSSSSTTRNIIMSSTGATLVNISATSGTTPPSDGFFYNTSTNKVSIYSSGSVTTATASFPFALIDYNSSGNPSSVKQKFSGLGYIGSIAWATKGITYLLPRGRRASTSRLYNTEETTNVVKIYNAGSLTDGDKALIFNSSGNLSYLGFADRYYDGELNYYIANGIRQAYCSIGEITISSGNITNATFKTPVNLGGLFNSYVVQDYINGSSWFRLWSNGWCEQGGEAQEDVAITLLKPYKNTNYCISALAKFYSIAGSANAGISYYDKTATSFKVIFGTSTGDTGILWKTEGYTE